MLSKQSKAEAAMAKAQDERLKTEAATRRHDVAAMLSKQSKAEAAMAKDQDKRLKTEAATRRHDVAAMLSKQGEAEAAMAKAQRAHLSKDRARLAADGSAGSDKRQAEAAVRRADATAREQGWATGATAMAARRSGTSPAPRPTPRVKPVGKSTMAAPRPAMAAPKPAMAAPKPAVARPEANAAIPIPAKPTHDDLTLVHGIGPGMQAHLNNAGVFTFKQLAKADVDHLRKELGDVARLARMDDWIGEAKGLAESG